MLVTSLPRMTSVRLEHNSNAKPPMLVTLLGIVTPGQTEAKTERIGSDVSDAAAKGDVGQAGTD
jgi:hypothetical protein